MPILILVLFIGLFMHDALMGDPRSARAVGEALSTPLLLALMLGPKLLIGLIYHLLCRRTLSHMTRGRSTAPLRRLERIAAILRPLIAASYLADLFALGALLRLRAAMGDLILVDEIIILLPPLAVNAWMWMAFYPVDVRMREATFMRRIERGEPVHIWSRRQFMLSQVRHQWALMGLPLLLLAGWWETVQMVFTDRLSDSTLLALMMGGALVVFLFTPVLIRRVWDTVPLPAGPLRDTLMGMCRQYRVGVRELLLWRTFGGMINGAVMGLVGPLRYILLTDGLLETMPAKQVEAVMAHELAHVRKHHMFWLLAVAAGSMELLRQLTEWVIGGSINAATSGAMAGWLPEPMVAAMTHRDAPRIVAMVFSMVAWYFLFGWVSRRFERQADTFAVQHLARQWHEQSGAGGTASSQLPEEAIGQAPPIPPPLPSAAQILTALETGAAIPAGNTAPSVSPGHIPRAAADIMAGALQTVADLNCIPTKRRSWRHGSIAWRQDYLRTLAGTPIEGASIDRQVRWIKWVGAALIAVNVAVQVWW